MKNKFKNLCRFSLSSFLLLLGLFLAVGQVKASSSDASFTESGTGTITAGTQQLLGCTTVVQQDYQPTLSWDGQSLTLVPSNQKAGSNQFGRDMHQTSDHFFYLVNPHLGTHTLSLSGYGSEGHAVCRVFENVDQSNPIYATSSAVDINSYTPMYFSTHQGSWATQVLAPYDSEYPVTGTVEGWSAGTEVRWDTNDTYIGLLSATTATSSSAVALQTITGHSNNGAGFFVELKIAQPTPVVSVLSPTDGVTISSGNVGVMVNVSNFNRFVVSAKLDASTSTPDIIFDTGWSTLNPATSTYIITPHFGGGYYDLYLSGVNGNGSTDVVRHFTVPAPVCTNWVYSDWSGCVYGYQSRSVQTSFPSGCAGGSPIISQECADNNPYSYWSTSLTFQNPYTCVKGFDCPVRFNYDQSAFSGSDYIVVKNVAGDVISTSTVVDATTVGKSNGLSVINLDTSGFATTSVNYLNVFGHHGSTVDPPVSLQVNMALYSDINNVLGTPAVSTSTGSFMGISIHDSVCTPDQWASDNWGTQLSCNAMTIVGNFGATVVKLAQNILQVAIQTITTLFPFNLPAKFYQSWQNSATASFPVSLAVFDIADANGNIKLKIPTAWGGSPTTDPIVFGEAVFMQNSDLAAFFNGIRALSTYLMWALFIYGIYHFGLDLTHESKGDDD